MSARHTRQSRLAEVGERGQALIESTTFDVEASAEGTVEAEYLARAGARVTTTHAAPAPDFVHSAAFRHAASRTHAAGAWRALGRLRARLTENRG